MIVLMISKLEILAAIPKAVPERVPQMVVWSFP
jgi:hypothetical protein